MHLYNSLGIPLKDINNKLKTATVSFLRGKHNSVSIFCRGASKGTLNDFLFNFGQLSAKLSKLYNYFIHDHIKLDMLFVEI